MSFWSGYMALRCKARSWRVWRHFSPASTGHRCNHGAPLRGCFQHRPRHHKRRQRMRRNEFHPSDCFGIFGAYRPLSSCWSVLCFVISKLDLGCMVWISGLLLDPFALAVPPTSSPISFPPSSAWTFVISVVKWKWSYPQFKKKLGSKNLSRNLYVNCVIGVFYVHLILYACV